MAASLRIDWSGLWEGSADRNPRQEPQCICTPPLPARLRLVQKDGANRGRKFWGCSRFPKNNCSFFDWVDEMWTMLPCCQSTNPKQVGRQIRHDKYGLPIAIVCGNEPPCSTVVKLVPPSRWDKLLVNDDAGSLADALSSLTISGSLMQQKSSTSKPARLCSDENVDPMNHLIHSASLSVSQKTSIELNKRGSQLNDQVNKNMADAIRVKRITRGQRFDVDKARFKSALLPHQQTGVAWMTYREENCCNPRGGLLCDDAGLGKTVQIIALIIGKLYEESGTPRCTLIVCPLSVLDQWESEIETHAPGSLKVAKYHGTERHRLSRSLSSFDIVISTYATVARSHETEGILQSIFWKRVCLDEAHVVRNSASKASIAVTKLRAHSRWFITATPMQNRCTDIFAAFRFLRFKPFCDRFEWERFFGIDISSGSKKALLKLKPIVEGVMMRRMKIDDGLDGKKLIELPPRIETTHRLQFMTSWERETYSSLARKGRELGKDERICYGEKLGHLTLMRRCCDGIIPESAELEASSHFNNTADIDNLSTKIQFSLKLVGSIQATESIVIFSQWTKMLDLVQEALTKEARSVYRLDGSMSPKAKVRAIRSFVRDPKSSIFLVSLHCGGVGLNLVKANHVILLDPWFNPAIESQACDRCHRIGQTKPTHMHRITIAGTIEEKILVLQEKKAKAASTVLGERESAALSKATKEPSGSGVINAKELAELLRG